MSEAKSAAPWSPNGAVAHKCRSSPGSSATKTKVSTTIRSKAPHPEHHEVDFAIRNKLFASPGPELQEVKKSKSRLLALSRLTSSIKWTTFDWRRVLFFCFICQQEQTSWRLPDRCASIYWTSVGWEEGATPLCHDFEEGASPRYTAFLRCLPSLFHNHRYGHTYCVTQKLHRLIDTDVRHQQRRRSDTHRGSHTGRSARFRLKPFVARDSISNQLPPAIRLSTCVSERPHTCGQYDSSCRSDTNVRGFHNRLLPVLI